MFIVIFRLIACALLYGYEKRLEEHEISRWGWGGRDRMVWRRRCNTHTLMYGAGQTALHSIP
jgi:hypothetical protein